MLLGCPFCGAPIAPRDLDPSQGTGRCARCGDVRPVVGRPDAAAPMELRTALARARAWLRWHFAWQGARGELRFVSTHRSSLAESRIGQSFAGGAALLFFWWFSFHRRFALLDGLEPEVLVLGLAALILIAALIAVRWHPERIELDRERLRWSTGFLLPRETVPLAVVRGFRASIPAANEGSVTCTLLVDLASRAPIELAVRNGPEVIVAARDRLNEALYVVRALPEMGPYRGAS